MVGHPAQRFVGSAIPRQHMAYPYHQQAIPQPPIQSQHILAPGVAPYFHQDIYQGLIAKQHSPDVPADQPSPTPQNSAEGDHPIGYGAFGVVW